MMLEMKLRDERKAGLREGLEKGKKEIAVKLLRQNHPIPFIVDVTGLSEEAVLKLKHTIGSKK